MESKEKLQITKGIWTASKNHFFWDIFTDDPDRFMGFNLTLFNKQSNNKNISLSGENEANAILIADAGTTYNKCQLLPSELLEQRNELIDILKITMDYMPYTHIQGTERAKQLIQKLESNGK